MSALQPQLDEVVDVLLFHDEPMLFVCSNVVGTPFLAVLAEIQPDSKTWLCAPMSESRRAAVCRGELDLYDAFHDSETRTLFRVTRRLQDNVIRESFEEVAAAQVDDDELPLRGDRVRVRDREPASRPSIVELARAERTDILRLRLSMHGGGQAIPSNLLGSLLLSTQGSVNAIAQSLASRNGRRNHLHAQNPHELFVTATYAGSFGIEFRGATRADLLFDTPLVPALEQFFSVLRAGHERRADSLVEIARHLKQRSVARLRTFLEQVQTGVEELEASWGRPNERQARVALLNAADADFCLSLFSESREDARERFTIRGQLVGLNSRTKTYELFNVDEPGKIAGRVDDSIFQRAETFIINQIYRATVDEIVSVKPSGEVESKYRLMNLEPS